MSVYETDIQAIEDKTPVVNPGNYSPVTVDMKDTLGAIFLGLLALIMLIGWTRAEARNRALMKQLDITVGNHVVNEG